MSSELTEAIAAYGLIGSRLAPPQHEATAEQWHRLCQRVEQQRIAGFLATAIDDSAWPATTAQAEHANELHTATAVTSLQIERQLLEVSAMFDVAGIAYRVLKGPAHAHLLYENPAVRSFGDLDLLVPSEHVDEAIRLLERHGGARRFPEPRPGFDRRFSKGASIRMPSGLEIDVHRTFVAGPFGFSIELSRLFERRANFMLAGKTLPALAPEERLLNACYHAVLSHRPPRLVALRDIAQMAVDDRLDTEVILEMARSWRAEVVVARAVTSTWRTLGLTEPTPLTQWAEHYSPDRAEQQRLNVYSGSRRSYAGQAIAAVRVIPGLTNKAAYALAIALPKRAPHRTPAVTRWRRGIRVLLRHD